MSTTLQRRKRFERGMTVLVIAALLASLMPVPVSASSTVAQPTRQINQLPGVPSVPAPGVLVPASWHRGQALRQPWMQTLRCQTLEQGVLYRQPTIDRARRQLVPILIVNEKVDVLLSHALQRFVTG